MLRSCWTPFILAAMMAVGCASLRPKLAIDTEIFKGMICEGREAAGVEYLKQGHYSQRDITERLERVRRECGQR